MFIAVNAVMRCISTREREKESERERERVREREREIKKQRQKEMEGRQRGNREGRLRAEESERKECDYRKAIVFSRAIYFANKWKTQIL